MQIIAKPIDVIASFTKEGIPTPIRFKYQEERGESIVIKIDQILFKEVERFAGNQMFVFRCQSTTGDALRVFDLKYELVSCKWMLFKI
jgi:hypothetical protein